MFLGQMPRKPNKEYALAELKGKVTIFAAFVAIVRATPYVLHYLYGEKQQLSLEL
ncbi:hypothetical protein ACHQM5_023320 [Ranunculus cassubicifolius]